jgi:hypothetical protein
VVAETPSGVGRSVAGRYRIVRQLGRGGMGVVWLADDEVVGRQVALKELRAPAGSGPEVRDEFIQRALAEARNAARVRHPNVVALYDVVPAGRADDAVYLVLEAVNALTLDELVRRVGPLADERAARIGTQLLDVLDAAHALGIVHRDVKPANILIADGDVVKLTDFGIAHRETDTRLTKAGVIGTRAYLAPELFDAGAITPAADLWSLGATLHFMVEGSGPFERDSTSAVLRAILIDEPPAPSCGSGLATVISRLLDRDPAARASGAEVRELLGRVGGEADETDDAGEAADADADDADNGTAHTPRPTKLAPARIRPGVTIAVPALLKRRTWPYFLVRLTCSVTVTACFVILDVMRPSAWYLTLACGWGLWTVFLLPEPFEDRTQVVVSNAGLTVTVYRLTRAGSLTYGFDWRDVEALAVLDASRINGKLHGPAGRRRRIAYKLAVVKVRAGTPPPARLVRNVGVLGPDCYPLATRFPHERQLGSALAQVGMAGVVVPTEDFLTSYLPAYRELVTDVAAKTG